MVAPVLYSLPEGEPSIPWYFLRHSTLDSNPPAASMTPRRAPTRTFFPARLMTAPITRPSSMMSSSMGESSHNGTPSFSTTASRNAVAHADPIPVSRLPVTTPPAPRNTSCAPRMKPEGVDHARPSNHTSSVFAGSGTAPSIVSHHDPILFESSGLTSIPRPIFPPGSSG